MSASRGHFRSLRSVCGPPPAAEGAPLIALQDSANIRISDFVEHESSVFVSPLDPRTLIVYNNAGTGGGRVWTSTDCGLTWASNLTAPSDPAAAIIGDSQFGAAGRFIVVANPGTGCGGPCGHYKDSPAGSWTAFAVADFGLAEKPHVWVDNSPHSPSGVRYRPYAVWGDKFQQIVVSTPEEESWISASIPHGPTQLLKFSPNVQTGRTGRVYVAWARMDGVVPNTASTTSFGFSEMASLTPFAFQPETIVLRDSVGGLNPLVSPEVWTIPSMAVDKSDPAQDKLFLVWADNPTGSDKADILMMKGTAALPSGSVVWDTGNLIRVNQNVNSNAAQYWPWITWDECSDVLAVVFLEKISDGITHTRMAASDDHGATWAEIQISDVGWGGQSVNAYDYIGIASGDCAATAAWSDTRDTLLKAYASRVLLWGIASIGYTVQALPGDIVRVVVTWTTSVGASSGDQLVVVPPAGVPAGSVTGYTITNGGKTHTAIYEGPCVPDDHGDIWTFTVRSQRGACVQIRTGTGSFQVPYCVD